MKFSKILVGVILAGVVLCSAPQNTLANNKTCKKITNKIDQSIFIQTTKVFSYKLGKHKYKWKTGYATTTVNIRKKPTIKSKDLGDFTINQKIKYAKLNKNWCVVLYHNKLCYVHADYISHKKIEIPVVDQNEVNLLAHLVFAEANTLGETGMKYAGSVVLNRVKSSKYPNTLYGVIYDQGQYQCTVNGAMSKTPTQEAYDVARYLLTYGSVLPESVVYQAEFVQGQGVYTTLGNTYFCY